MSVKLLTEHHLECLSLKGGWRGSSESTHVKMPPCLKSHALAHLVLLTACLSGRYGTNCNSSCGHCQDTKTCDRETGKCAPCQAGWKGEKCDSCK